MIIPTALCACEIFLARLLLTLYSSHISDIIFPGSLGESAIVAPTEPKKKPLSTRRNVRLGTSATNGLLSENIKITDDNPTRSNRAVPHISDRNNFRRVGFSSFMSSKRLFSQFELQRRSGPSMQAHREPAAASHMCRYSAHVAAM